MRISSEKSAVLAMIVAQIDRQRRRCAFARAILLSPNTSEAAKARACGEAFEVMERLRHLGTLLVHLGDVDDIGRALLDTTQDAIAQMAA